MTEITRRGLMTPSCWLVIPSRGILAKKTNFIFRAVFTWKILHLPSSYAPHKKTIFACNVKKYSRMPRSVDELAAQSGQRLKPGRCSRTIRFGYQEGCGANVVLTRRVMARRKGFEPPDPQIRSLKLSNFISDCPPARRKPTARLERCRLCRCVFEPAWALAEPLSARHSAIGIP